MSTFVAIKLTYKAIIFKLYELTYRATEVDV